MDTLPNEQLNNAPQIDKELIDEGTILDISPYKPLYNCIPQVDRPYEELNDDFRKQTFPVSVKQTAAIQVRPISHIFFEQIRTQTPNPCSSECSKTNQVILDDDQSKDKTQCITSSSSNVNSVRLDGVTNPPDLPVYLDLLDETASENGNEYDIINEEQRCTNSPTNRPLPVLPQSVLEPFNTNAGKSNSNDSKIVSRRICFCITKNILVLTALLVVFVTGGFIAIKMLPTKVDEHKGKIFVRSIHF